MAVVLERNCAMLVHFDKPISASEIKTALEGHDTFAKIQSMQTAIKMLLSGEQLPAFFITVVRYVLPSEDHTVQKLLLLYLVSDSKAGPVYMHFRTCATNRSCSKTLKGLATR
jgi:coatomer subunit beta